MSKLIIWLAINRAINEPQLLVSSYILILQLPNESSQLSGEETKLRKTHFTERETKFPHLTLMPPPCSSQNLLHDDQVELGCEDNLGSNRILNLAQLHVQGSCF